MNVHNYLFDEEDLDTTVKFERIPRRKSFDDDTRGRHHNKKKQSHRPIEVPNKEESQ